MEITVVPPSLNSNLCWSDASENLWFVTNPNRSKGGFLISNGPIIGEVSKRGFDISAARKDLDYEAAINIKPESH